MKLRNLLALQVVLWLSLCAASEPNQSTNQAPGQEWGPESHGLVLSVMNGKTELAIGESILISGILKNVGQQTTMVIVQEPCYGCKLLVKEGANAEHTMAEVTAPRKVLAYNKVALAPAEQLQLAPSFSFHSDRAGTYAIRLMRKIPIGDGKQDADLFSNAFTITVKGLEKKERERP